jgi:glucose/arabinose dehydrogenase
VRRIALAVLFLAAFAAPAFAQNVPPNFVVEDVAPGAGFVVPVQAVWLPDGRMLVVEKQGRLQMVKNGIKNAQPVWQSQAEVLDQQDRGFLSVAVDPHYFVNHYIYLLYTVDPDSDGVDDNTYGYGRLTRYTINFTDSNTVIPSSRTILMGTTWTDGPEDLSASHTIGTVRFAQDGSLLITAGDGAQFSNTDAGGQSPQVFAPNGTLGNIDPYEDIGAFRAQDIKTLNGKVLRLNPATGHGYAGNPFADGNLADKQSKVWEYGLRNPFRFHIRAGTGATDTSAANPGIIYLGDVGWNTWEEMDICKTGGNNYGWPCYEGGYTTAYQVENPPHSGCASYGTAANPVSPTLPVAWWNHSVGTGSNPVGLTGNCSIGGTFYNGTQYPAGFQGKYFFLDYGQGWLKYATVDANNNLLSITDFADGLQGPCDLETDPVTGDLIYCALYTNQVLRIRYTGLTGGNHAPVAHAQGSPNVGTSPLTVNFASTGTTDQDGDPMTLSWNFGDGQGASGGTASHTYTNVGSYEAVLTADDGKGGIGRDSVKIDVLSSVSFPTTGVLDDFNRADGPLGPNWVGTDANIVISGGQITENLSVWNDAVWNATIFGPDQEAFYTLNAITPSAPEHDIELKVQGQYSGNGTVEVRYDATVNNIVLSTYDAAFGWRSWLTIAPITLQAGDQLGARAYSNGTVEIYRNGTKIGTGSVTQWPFFAQGGGIGLEMAGATFSHIDNFGGGNAVLNSNTPPIAFIDSPLDSSFFETGVTVHLRGHAHDAQDSANVLIPRWEVDMHHNNHIHPLVDQSDSASFDIVPLNHDDGTGIWMLVRYIVTDTGGLKDTTYARIFPACDVTPSIAQTSPPQPGTTTPAGFFFKIYNTGPMPAHIFHWILMSDAGQLAAGDTIIAAHDSVFIYRLLPPTLTAGVHTLRVIADTLQAAGTDSIKTLVETNEFNNVAVSTVTVISGAGTLGAPNVITRLSLSNPYPNPTGGRMQLTLALPTESTVDFDVIDVQGRRMWHTGQQTLAAGLWPLSWEGRDAAGMQAHPGLYLARVTVNGHEFVRRFALLH